MMNENRAGWSIFPSKFGLAVCCLAAALAVSAERESQAGQEPTAKAAPEVKARPADVGSLEAILASLYDSISGPMGSRDWNRLRGLFLPGARLIPSVHGADGTTAARVLSVEEFIKVVEPRIKQEGFFEQEIHRRVDRFGAVAHVFSTYESRRALSDAQPFARGINSIQLFFDGQRWWVVTILWDSERPNSRYPRASFPATTGKPALETRCPGSLARPVEKRRVASCHGPLAGTYYFASLKSPAVTTES